MAKKADKKTDKKTEAAPTRNDISDLLADINKNAKGAAVVMPASQINHPFGLRRPFGILSLDLEIAGGLPAGSVCQLYGKPGTCKNYLSDQLFTQVQKNYGEDANLFFASFGYGYDKGFGRLNGVSIALPAAEIEFLRDEMASRGGVMSDVELTDLRTQVGNFVEVRMGKEALAKEKPAEAILEAVVQLIASNRFQLGILDETNMGETKYGVAAQLGKDPRQADLATLITNFLKKFFSAVNTISEDGTPNKTTFVEISEVRAKIGGFSPNPNATTQSGGYALQHAKAIDIHTRPGAKIQEASRYVGKEINWRVDKAKLGSHEGATGSFEYRFGLGVDRVADTVTVLQQQGLVTNRGAWYYNVEGERLGQGRDSVVEIFRADAGLLAEYRAEALRLAGVAFRVTG